MTAEQRAEIDALPIPADGNLAGALANVVKADIELSAGTPEEIAAIRARFESLTTRGEANAYAAEVVAKVHQIKEERRLARLSGSAGPDASTA